MIRVNLLPGPQKRRGGGGAKLPNFGEMFAKVKDPLLIGAVGAWIVGLAVIGVLYFAGAKAHSSAESRVQRVEAEARRYRALRAQKTKAEHLRDSLVVELGKIREIDADRYVWPHVLDEVTHALPDYTWLVGLSYVPTGPVSQVVTTTRGARGAKGAQPDTAAPPPPIKFTIDGRTSDISAYTRFVRQLNNSPWITDLVIGAANAVEEEGRQVTAFTVSGTFQTADSAYIRTVPVAASVR